LLRGARNDSKKVVIARRRATEQSRIARCGDLRVGIIGEERRGLAVNS
jgi:hypothetical protein